MLKGQNSLHGTIAIYVVFFVLYRLLNEKGFAGTYLIRNGRHERQDVEMVLSVWQEDRCHHYFIFREAVNIIHYYLHMFAEYNS